MNDKLKSIWRRSILPDIFIFRLPGRFFHWLFSWRGIRRILIVLAWAATIIALLYGEENWRGRHAWNKYRKQQEAKGIQFDYTAFIPKPVPDEENFATTPLIKSWFPVNKELEWQDDYSRSVSKISDARAKKDGSIRHFTDLVVWGNAFAAIRSGETNRHQMSYETNKLDVETRAKAAPGVLDGLKTSDVYLAELRKASSRPHSRYPINYNLEDPWGILLPHLANIKGPVQRLRLKACAELAGGQSENALKDVILMLYLADSLKDEPILISYLVRLACVQIAIQPVWEGLAEHRWSDAQLQELQTRFQQFDFLTDIKRPLDGERAAGILTVDLLYRKKYRMSSLGGFSSEESPRFATLALQDFVFRIAPHGWYHQEQLNYCRLSHLQSGGAFDANKKRVSPSQIADNAKEFEREIAGGRLGRDLNAFVHHHVIASLLLTALGGLPRKAAAAQTTTDRATLACALERYRLANGHFPEKLEELAPRFIAQLPHDMITGEPYKYRRANDGQFVLYSVGWNEKDDGGVPGKTLFDEKQGDWVWRYPAKE